jgi:hypothetical protein
MSDLFIGKGNLAGKGVYANRDFKAGEVVVRYHLKPVTDQEFEKLPESEKMFVHSHYGMKYLYSEPERYVNHSPHPNTKQDLERKHDIAVRSIAKGEMITTDATKDDIEFD